MRYTDGHVELTTDGPYGKVRVTPTEDRARVQLLAILKAIGMSDHAAPAHARIALDRPESRSAVLDALAVSVDVYADFEADDGRTYPLFNPDLPVFECDEPGCERAVSREFARCDEHATARLADDDLTVRAMKL